MILEAGGSGAMLAGALHFGEPIIANGPHSQDR